MRKGNSMKEHEDESIVLSEEEVEAAKEEMQEGVYEHVFKRPFEWEGKVYGKLVFDFDSLTGKDTLAIDRELTAQGIFAVVRSLNVEFQIRAAARACKEKLGTDAFEAMPIRDFEKIMNHVRGFFAAAE